MGLFLVRRERICSTRRISSSRPITGSSLPLRASSLRLSAYLPSALNSCEAVCESTVAPLRNVRIASISSFSVAPARLSRSAAAPRSATSPSSRCSTEAYLSPKLRVKSTARWITFELSCEKNCSPPPVTRGSAATARFASSRSPRTLTPTRPSRNVASESSSRTSTLSRCIGSTAWLPLSLASVKASCKVSCALMVKLLMFISECVCLFHGSIRYSAKCLPTPSGRPKCHPAQQSVTPERHPATICHRADAAESPAARRDHPRPCDPTGQIIGAGALPFGDCLLSLRYYE